MPLSHTRARARARRGRRYLDERRGQRSSRSIVERVFRYASVSLSVCLNVFRYACLIRIVHRAGLSDSARIFAAPRGVLGDEE